MAETVSVNIQMDPDLKEQAEMIFRDMGLNMTSAVNLFVRQTLLQGKIPFAIYADPFYSESNMKALRESVQQAKEGKIVVKTMTELEQIAGEDSTLYHTYCNRREYQKKEMNL